MKKSTWLGLVAPLALAGCVAERAAPAAGARHDAFSSRAPAAGREIAVTRTPPPARVERETVAPGPNYVWTCGHWRWTGTDYVWIPGRWVVRPRPGATFVQGQWVRGAAGWVWLEGHWR